jgi:hypothetical protein
MGRGCKSPMAFLATIIYIGGAIIGGSAAIDRFFGRESLQPSALGIASSALIRVPGLETVGRAIQSVTAYATAWREQPTAIPVTLLPFLRRGRGLGGTDTYLIEQLARLQEERVALPFPEEVWEPGVLQHESVVWLNTTIQGIQGVSPAEAEVLRVKDLIRGLLRRLNGATARYHSSLLHHALYGRLEANLERLIAERRGEELRKAMYADVYSEAALMAAWQSEVGRRGGVGFGSVDFGAMLDDLRKYTLEVSPRDTGAALAALMDWLLRGKRAYVTAADVDRRLKELGEPLHARVAGATGVFLRVLLSYSALGVALEWLVRSQEQVFVLNVPSLAHQTLPQLEDVSRAPTSMLTTRESDAWS